jgi:hypothetical protein
MRNGNIGFHAYKNSQVSPGDFLIDTIKAGEIEVAHQKIKLFGIGDIGFQQFREKIVLVGDKSGHFYLLVMFGAKILPDFFEAVYRKFYGCGIRIEDK